MLARSPAVTYQWELFGPLAQELPPLLVRHWRELASHQEVAPLDFDWQRYLALEVAGILKVLTVRNESGTLIGYHFVLVAPNLHSASTLWAQSDIFWLDPAYRSGWWGVKLLKIVRDQLAATGVKVHYANIKLHFDAERGTLDKIFRRLGYAPEEMVYSQWLKPQDS